MNCIVKTIMIATSILPIVTFAQTCIEPPKTVIIESYRLPITAGKTTTLIFPYAIKSVDRGSQDVLAQKATGVENILLVKAGREHFQETNLSVITSDGKLYSMLLTYSSNPYPINLSFMSDSSLSTPALLQEGHNEAELASRAQQVWEKERTLYGIRDKNGKVLLRLLGIYVQNNVLYFQLGVQNHSGISYDIEKVRFFTKDQKKYKRTASQEIEYQPLYAYGDTSTIKSGDDKILVFALPKFTIQDQKYSCIQVMEKSGTRMLELRLRNHTLVGANLLEL